MRRSKGKSGCFGVQKKPSGRYQAKIGIGDGKYKCLGYYDSAKQAAKAYDKEAIILRRPFSKLNYPKKAPVGYTPIQQLLRSNNTIGYRGVTKNGKNFRAQSKIGGKLANLGTHDTIQPKKQPLPTIVLFSKPTNPHLY